MSMVDPPSPRRHRSPARTWRGMSPWLWSAVILALVAGIAAALILAKAAGGGAPPWAQDSGVRPVVPATPTAAPPTADLPEGAFAGDGGPDDPVKTYLVGPQIRPGRYATQGALNPEASGHWEKLRLRAVGEAPTPAGSGEVVGPVTVSLREGEVFITSGFKPWTRVPDDDE